MSERLAFPFRNVYARLDRELRCLRCFLLGHNIAAGVWDEPDLCRRCWREDPDQSRTLWGMANSAFAFLIEHSKQFIRFDDWITKTKLGWWLPSWGEY